LRGHKSQFLHSCFCKRFIYSPDRSAYSAAGKLVNRPWEYIDRLQTHENGTEAARFLFWEYINPNLFAVHRLAESISWLHKRLQIRAGRALLYMCTTNIPGFQAVRGVNPVLQVIFTFAQMYFVFMNARVSGNGHNSQIYFATDS
jgi:hypothetical protein